MSMYINSSAVQLILVCSRGVIYPGFIGRSFGNDMMFGWVD